MLGMEDPVVGLAWLLTVGATVFGIVYGTLNWNRKEEDES